MTQSMDYTATVKTKRCKNTGMTEEIIRRLHGQPGARVMAVVELCVDDAHNKHDAPNHVDFTIEQLVPFPDDRGRPASAAADQVRSPGTDPAQRRRAAGHRHSGRPRAVRRGRHRGPARPPGRPAPRLRPRRGRRRLRGLSRGLRPPAARHRPGAGRRARRGAGGRPGRRPGAGARGLRPGAWGVIRHLPAEHFHQTVEDFDPPPAGCGPAGTKDTPRTTRAGPGPLSTRTGALLPRPSPQLHTQHPAIHALPRDRPAHQHSDHPETPNRVTYTDDRPPAAPPVEPPWEPTEDPGVSLYAVNGTTSTRPAGDRTPPHDVLAEQSVLGAMLITTQAIDDVEPELDPADFYRPAHEDIYDSILALHSTGAPVDMVTVAGHLATRPAPGKTSRTRNLLEHVGGPTYLHTLAADLPHPRATPPTTPRSSATTPDSAPSSPPAPASPSSATPPTSTASTPTSAKPSRPSTTPSTASGPAPPAPASAPASPTSPGSSRRPSTPTSPPPSTSNRTDGTALFYAGKVNGIFGDPEAGKTWLAQLAIVEALNAGGTAAMIDVDHNGPDHTAARLLLLGAHPEHLADPDRFRYYEPEDGDQLRAAVDDITTRAPDVVLIDSIGEVFPMLGVNDQRRRRESPPPCARSAPDQPCAGSCVITIDHLPKSPEARATGFAIGSIAKKRMIRGSYLRADAAAQPSPRPDRPHHPAHREGHHRRAPPLLRRRLRRHPHPRLHPRPHPHLAHRPRRPPR